jgi:hypothetical protein
MPVYETEAEALKAEGQIYRHYKSGIYRLLYTDVHHTETGEVLVIYEHLYPHKYQVYARPESMFFGLLEDGRSRFSLIMKG